MNKRAELFAKADAILVDVRQQMALLIDKVGEVSTRRGHADGVWLVRTVRGPGGLKVEVGGYAAEHYTPDVPYDKTGTVTLEDLAFQDISALAYAAALKLAEEGA